MASAPAGTNQWLLQQVETLKQRFSKKERKVFLKMQAQDRLDKLRQNLALKNRLKEESDLPTCSSGRGSFNPHSLQTSPWENSQWQKESDLPSCSSPRSGMFTPHSFQTSPWENNQWQSLVLSDNSDVSRFKNNLYNNEEEKRKFEKDAQSKRRALEQKLNHRMRKKRSKAKEESSKPQSPKEKERSSIRARVDLQKFEAAKSKKKGLKLSPAFGKDEPKRKALKVSTEFEKDEPKRMAPIDSPVFEKDKSKRKSHKVSPEFDKDEPKRKALKVSPEFEKEPKQKAPKVSQEFTKAINPVNCHSKYKQFYSSEQEKYPPVNSKGKRNSPLTNKNDKQRKVNICAGVNVGIEYKSPKENPSTGKNSDILTPVAKMNLFKRKISSVYSENSVSELRNSQESVMPSTSTAPKERSFLGGKIKGMLSKTYEGLQGKIKHSLKSLINYSTGEPNLQLDQTQSSPSNIYTRATGSDFLNVTTHLQNVRQLVPQDEQMDWEFSNSYSFTNELPTDPTVYIVVDTNVFISSLDVVKRIKGKKIKGMNVAIIVPWQVLKELDYLKQNMSNHTVRNCSRVAIKFLNNVLSEVNASVYGQTSQHSLTEIEGFQVDIPDDKLIKCCLQLKVEGRLVLFLTNDINLSNKAIVCGITTVGDKMLTSIIDEGMLNQDKLYPFERTPMNENVTSTNVYNLTVTFKKFLTLVYEKYLKQKYNELWQFFSPGKQPWTFAAVLKCFDDLNSICNESFVHSTALHLAELQKLLNNCSYNNLTKTKAEQYGKLCHYLAKALNYNYREEVEEFGRNSAFYKRINLEGPEPGSTYANQCSQMTVYYFNLFEDKLAGYCCWLSTHLSLPFTPLKCPSALPDQATVQDRVYYKNCLNILLTSLQCIYAVPVESVTQNTNGVEDIYLTLNKHLDSNCDLDFSIGDVLLFCQESSLRCSFPEAVATFNFYLQFLSSV